MFAKCPSAKTWGITIFAIAAAERLGVNAGDESLEGISQLSWKLRHADIFAFTVAYPYVDLAGMMTIQRQRAPMWQ
jgi:hypothetical protein